MVEGRGFPPGRPRSTARPVALVADPEPRLRQLLRLALEPAGFQVVEAQTTSEALRRARRYQPSVIILDVWLPKPGAFHLIRQLRLDPASSEARIAVTAVDCDPDMARAAYDLGADYFVSKPFRPSRLVALFSAASSQAVGAEREPVAIHRRLGPERPNCAGPAAGEAKILEFPSGRVWARRDQETAT